MSYVQAKQHIWYNTIDRKGILSNKGDNMKEIHIIYEGHGCYLYSTTGEREYVIFSTSADIDGDETGTATASSTTVTISGDSLTSGSTLPAAGDYISIIATGE